MYHNESRHISNNALRLDLKLNLASNCRLEYLEDVELSVAVNILLVSPQLAVKVEGFPALLTHRVPGLLVLLLDVLTEVREFLLTDLTFKLK